MTNMVPNIDMMVPNGGAPSSGSGSITINTTPILGGTDLHVLYDNAGTVGEAANFLIVNGQPYVTLGSSYLYNGNNILYLDTVNGCYIGMAGNFNVTGVDNMGMGQGALSSLTTGASNVAIGRSAQSNNTTGVQNVALGTNSMINNHTANNNVAIGFDTLFNIDTSGNDNNIAIGAFAMFLGTSGSGNVAIGNSAMISANGATNSIAIGGGALENTTAGGNIAIGPSAGFRITSGGNNTCIGFTAGVSITTGANNTAIGAAGLSSALSNAIVLSDGAGNIRLDYNDTNANKWTLTGGLNCPFMSTAGIVVNDGSGNVTSDSTVAAATVTANFTADHRLQVTIGATTYYIAMSTTAW